jgi:hypothetical protein
MTDDQLAAVASLGAEVDLFMKGHPIYKLIVGGIEAAAKEAENDGDWTPGKTTDPNAIAIYNAFNSGRKTEQGFVKSVLERHVLNGLEAQKELARRNKAKGADKAT